MNVIDNYFWDIFLFASWCCSVVNFHVLSFYYLLSLIDLTIIDGFQSEISRAADYDVMQ